jgi:hypothetical protein
MHPKRRTTSKVLRVMGEESLLCQLRRTFKVTTDSSYNTKLSAS